MKKLVLVSMHEDRMPGSQAGYVTEFLVEEDSTGLRAQLMSEQEEEMRHAGWGGGLFRHVWSVVTADAVDDDVRRRLYSDTAPGVWRLRQWRQDLLPE